MTDVGPNTLDNSVDFGTEDNNLTVIIGALCGVVIVIQFVVIGFLLWKIYKFKKDHELIKRCILNSDQVIIRRREEGRSIWGERDMISKQDLLPFYKEENSSLIEDPFAEKSKSCNEEPEETKECNHTNRETINQGDLLRFPEKENTLLNQDPFDEKSTSCNGEAERNKRME
ncbi:uncharacterized protein LOC112569690 [Pomacea canaliculata]|uniref:uncharacterized protein LOC112569690 n=1 Tax=Pomacea canaliculata TaxID=400727 RepID=UPI000D73AB65|nr:uncharacterized protein LOC112569690 [Pomacea canaliculata]XP_025103366.1 uncharacterized protein LOC112569690 [Pomacea canaliculata]